MLKHLLLLIICTTHLLANSQNIQLHSIDKERLNSELNNNKTFKYQVVFIFTNKCIGTKYLMEKIRFLKQQPIRSTNFLLCCSSRMKDSNTTRKIITDAQLGLDTIYLIDKHQYREKLTDDRYKGFLFRNDICSQCAKDEIGVPYTIVYNAQGEIIKFGYINREELVKYLSE